VLLGIKPDRPETGYGYISTGKESVSFFEVKGFFEKPDFKTAQKYIKRRNFFWNPGIFVWRTETILNEFKKHAPYILDPLQSSYPFKNFGDLASCFKLIPSEAIDTAIMEKSSEINMLKASFNWDDVGSWLSLERILPSDSNQNHHNGKEIYHYKSTGNISSLKKEFAAFLGVNDLVVVEEDDVLFIANKKSLSDIKVLLSEIRKNRSLQKYLE
jgi:mannose-1-phosphate guanylyltransferase